MTSSAQQNRDRYLASKFLSPQFILNRDVIGGVSDFVIPLSSVESVLGKPLPSPMYTTASGVCAYTKEDNVISVEEFVDRLHRNNDDNNYIFYTVNMKKLHSVCDDDNTRVAVELIKLKYLCVPNLTALVNYIEESCPLVRVPFENVLSKESCIFELLELRRDLN